MDCFISHHNTLKYESVFFEFIFTFLRLKKSTLDKKSILDSFLKHS